MSFSMVFDVANDTANGRVNADILLQEILDSGITTGLPVENVGVDGGSVTGRGQVTGGTLTVTFTSAPDSGDQTTVTNTVAAHQGDAFGPSVLRLSDSAVSSTTQNTPQTKLSGTPPALQDGDYLLLWYAEIRVQSVVSNSGVRATVTVDGTEIGEDNWDLDQWHVFSGSISSQLVAGAKPAVVMSFERIGVSNTVEIRRARMVLTKE